MTAIATVPNVVDVAVAPIEWDDTVGMLSLLQRGAPITTYLQRALEFEGAFMGVDDGVGDDQPVSIMVSGTLEPQPLGTPEPQPMPRPTIPAPAPEVAPIADAAPIAQSAVESEAERQAERESERQAEREAERQAEREADRRAERAADRAERAAERQAERAAERRAQRAAERRAQRAAERAPAPPAWNNAPRVTWYGPGFYDNRTACGQRYTRQIVGVAHKTLPCGTMVEFRWNGITARAPVIDRGPYGPAGYLFDFSAALSCDVFKPRGVKNGCFTRQNVAWRIVGRNN